MLKIIAGKFRFQSLFPLEGETTRPTTAFVREAIFNICQNEIEGAFFLDLFAGSGAMGLEAISRGAKKVVFVEIHKTALEVIRKNIAKLKAENESHILPMDIFKAITFLQKAKELFTMIYIDPPYGYFEDGDFVERLLKEASVLLAKGGKIYLEAPLSFSLNRKVASLPDALEIIEERKYGKSRIYIFEGREL